MYTYYNVEIQMSGTHETSEQFIKQIAIDLGAKPSDVDEIDTYHATLSFKSNLKPSEIKQRVQSVLAMYRMTLHYIDVIYRFEHEMTPDRFVVWSSGHEEEYHGEVIFVEDK